MKLTEALANIATQSTAATTAIARKTWSKGRIVRHATAAEQRDGLHAYASVTGKDVVSYDATRDDIEATDWVILNVDGTPLAPKDDAPTAPQTPKAKGAAATA